MKGLIAVLGGDGIGPEVTEHAVRVIERVAGLHDHELRFEAALMGGAAIDATGSALPPDTLDLCQRADAVLLGAIGGPKWSDPSAAVRPEQGLLDLRAALGVFANIRPVTPHPRLHDASPLKADRLRGVDLLVVRELTGGIYFGAKTETQTTASDLCEYTAEEIERVVRMAGALAMKRRRKLTSVDKANVLATSRLWRATTERLVRDEFPEIELEHVLVDAAAMHLLSRPADFDVIVTENMFGDILTDEASMLAGSMGMMPSASLGAERGGLYEPIHGSAPDIAGQALANPIGAILSGAMLLRHSLSLGAEAEQIERAVARAIESGARTADIATAADSPLTTSELADTVLDQL